MTPISTIDSGHKSASSNTHGRQRNQDRPHPLTVVKKGGDVATMTCGRRWNRPNMNDEIM